MRRAQSCFAVVAVLCTWCGMNASSGGDWPTWRFDVGRRAASPGELPGELHLQWVRELPSPQPAWPASQFKLRFDAGYEPVASGASLFVGSTVNDSITAYDTRSGEEQWRFYTAGPVRFAPACWEDRVYAVSDDGRLYCLDAATGDLLWDVAGGASTRTIIGNGRLVSAQPARGGVVVDNGVAYFAAGIWPSMGVFVNAIDARTGEALWINSETSGLFITHPHGADAFGSVSPQGHLALTDDAVIVPGGRTLPAVFDRETGELRHFNFGGKGSGGHRVMASGELILCGHEALRPRDGASVARFPATVSGAYGAIGNSAAQEIVLTVPRGRIEDVTTIDRRGREQTRPVFTPDGQQRARLSGPGQVHIQVGRHLLASGNNKVAAYDLERIDNGDQLDPVWSADVGGDVWTMIFADDRLFVVTADARIVCFGEARVPTVSHEWDPRPAAVPKEDTNDGPADELLRLAGAHAGYAVILGADDSGMVAGLLRRSDLAVIAVDEDAEQVDELRRSLDAHGEYGLRAAVRRGDPLRFEFPPYLASLAVADKPHDSLTKEELHRVFETLRPYGGTAVLRTTPRLHERLAEHASEPGFEQAEISRHEPWTVIRRAGPLPGAGVWTHQYGDASQSGMSRDKRVKAPFGVLWFGGPSNDDVLPRHGHGPAPQVAGVRHYIEGPDLLRCVDVYTGRVWWEREFPGLGAYYNNTAHHPGAGEIGSNYVSLPDAVFLVYGQELLALDAATGETIRSFRLPGSDSPHWGFIAIDGDTLIATASPVVVEGMNEDANRSKQPIIPDGSEALVEPHSAWAYLAGDDPTGEWTAVEFDAGDWKVGDAGFGYGDDDDRTVLKDMAGKYTRVYIRREFDGKEAAGAKSMQLMINYDDAFIAYLNGTEVVRKNVSRRSGAAAEGVGSHEAEGYETFDVSDFRKLLKPGRNVFSLEGHNKSSGSSDFTLDPYVVISAESAEEEEAKPAAIADTLLQSRYASSSRLIVAFDRHSGEMLWTREADYTFRHNGICLGAGKVYCIDGMSPAQLSLLRRRGITPEARPTLCAVDARSGEEVWSTSEDVFGTFLNYSAEHDILLQAGSAYRDRAEDEVDTGMVAYRAADGEPIWKNLNLKYGGPCLLWKDRIITNGAGGFSLNLLTGEPDGWEYLRMYGCNTAIGSEHLLTFRSGAAGFCDLAADSGTGNLSGFRSSCTSNLIVADGVLNAPDYTRTCTCAYQLQTSLAFIHMPQAEYWTFNRPEALTRPIDSLAINLGAPGDRRDDEGLLWFEYPVVGGPSPELTIETDPPRPEWFRHHASRVPEGELRWVAASGASNLKGLTLRLGRNRTPRSYRVTLVFLEPEQMKPGERVFSVTVGDSEVLTDVDVVQQAGGPLRPVIRQFTVENIGDELRIGLQSSTSHPPVLCGVSLSPL